MFNSNPTWLCDPIQSHAIDWPLFVDLFKSFSHSISVFLCSDPLLCLSHWPHSRLPPLAQAQSSSFQPFLLLVDRQKLNRTFERLLFSLQCACQNGLPPLPWRLPLSVAVHPNWTDLIGMFDAPFSRLGGVAGGTASSWQKDCAQPCDGNSIKSIAAVRESWLFFFRKGCELSYILCTLRASSCVIHPRTHLSSALFIGPYS